MGGNIGITSTPGQGSTFWFTAQLSCATPREQPLPAPDRFLSGLRVLIVDDHATNRFILHTHLTAWGAEVIEADSGAAALLLLTQAANERSPFALAILDIHMPDMDGFMLAQAIKSNPIICGITLVASVPWIATLTAARRSHWDFPRGCRNQPVNPCCGTV